MDNEIKAIVVETSISPEAVADAVIAEVESRVGQSVPNARTVANRLADKAAEVYSHNAQFRHSIRAKGNRGRDQLYVWMRHWLAAELRTVAPSILRELPSSFSVGHPISEGKE